MPGRDGVNASFVGWEENGRKIGDRCFVLSNDGRVCHVRWVTGSLTEQYDTLIADHLVVDAKVSDDDHWMFEVEDEPRRLVAVACQEVHQRGGYEAVLTALTQEGHLTAVDDLAREAVASAVFALRSDPAWSEIADQMGDEMPVLLKAAVKSAFSRMIQEEVLDAVASGNEEE